MPGISLRIAYPIIIAGLFIMVAFIALNYESLNTNFYIILFLLIVYIFLFGFAIGQNFASPVKRLLKSADNLSKGDLKSRFYLESKDELGELARVFNRIADSLEESRGETKTMEKSVDIKVQARTRALEETINALEQKIKNRTLELQRMAGELEQIKEQQNKKDNENSGLKNQEENIKEIDGRMPRKNRSKKLTMDEVENVNKDPEIII